MAKSIIQDEKVCYRCRSTLNLEKHHCVFGTANRKKADGDGLWVWLCHAHHHAVHNKDIDYKRYLEWIAEKKWLEVRHKNIADWIERYGRNYL